MKTKTYKEFVKESEEVNEAGMGMYNSEEQMNLSQVKADYSNAVLAQDHKAMAKLIKELVKANDAYIKWIKSK